MATKLDLPEVTGVEPRDAPSHVLEGLVAVFTRSTNRRAETLGDRVDALRPSRQ